VTVFVGLLRAVNVGGTGALAMADLRRLCAEAGFANVRTYIASGNVVFESERSKAEVKRALEAALAAHGGRKVTVLVRTAAELAEIFRASPFPDAEPKFTYAVFLDAPPPADALSRVAGREDEQIALGKSEIYIAYGAGMGRSKLRIPAAKEGTGRNMRTLAALVDMASRS
jgi:uncharacterized protein (DUF1697 family)